MEYNTELEQDFYEMTDEVLEAVRLAEGGALFEAFGLMFAAAREFRENIPQKDTLDALSALQVKRIESDLMYRAAAVSSQAMHTKEIKTRIQDLEDHYKRLR